jgi:hypothetical protein
MNARLLTLGIALMTQSNAYAQSNDECKYLQVLTYIKFNSAFNNQLKEYIRLSKPDKRAKTISINVTPWIEFIEVRQFKDSIYADSVGIDKDTLANDRLYYKKYNFEPYKSNFLEAIISKNEMSKLYLTFSKVIGTTLLVEILNFDNRPNRIRRIGRGIKLLFVFSPSGEVKKVFFAGVAYN